MFGNHGLGGLLEEGAHEKSPKCLGGNLGDFGGFCKGLQKCYHIQLESKDDIHHPQSINILTLSCLERIYYSNQKRKSHVWSGFVYLAVFCL
ncbi:hypothetical protein ELB75_03655 [Eikenella corrodens]|uniref:Uncharacterized protein n=1 Tax=Eikenella corrodens TaxID=539 RepID=A0A3S9SI78_EIKCO|nr:hypothetical protein ELB75_03655 [Eikenella corrodens]